MTRNATSVALAVVALAFPAGALAQDTTPTTPATTPEDTTGSYTTPLPTTPQTTPEDTTGSYTTPTPTTKVESQGGSKDDDDNGVAGDVAEDDGTTPSSGSATVDPGGTGTTGQQTDELAFTGGGAPMLTGALGVLALALGGVLLLRRRQTS
jgi:hypothetical protein